MEIKLDDVMDHNSLEEQCSCEWLENIERPCKDCNDTYRQPTYEGKQILDFVRKHLKIESEAK